MKRRGEPFLRSIRNRVLGALVVALGLVLGLNMWLEPRILVRPVSRAFDHALHEAAHVIAARVSAGAGGLRLDMDPLSARVLLTDPEDSLFFLVTGPAGEHLGGEPDLARSIGPGQNHAQVFDAVHRGEPVRGVTHVHATTRGPVTIHVAETKRARNRIEAGIAWVVFVFNAGLLLIALGLAYAVVGLGLRPLVHLSRDIEARGSDMLDPVPLAGLPSELVPLGRALNNLLAVIDRSSRAQRRFVADASHQLRTPLTGLQAQLELLGQEELPDALRERIRDAYQAARRLSHLAARLLALGRTDSLADPLVEMVPVDLGDLVEESASTFLDRALAKQIDLGFEAESAPIVGCGWMLRELLSNLIDNAIAYTPNGGHVTVRSGVRGGWSVIEVEDDGPGIAPSERERVFDRFYRGVEGDGKGCGLGLAIVKQIADAHTAEVSVGVPEGGSGALLRVRFALAQDGSGRPAPTQVEA